MKLLTLLLILPLFALSQVELEPVLSFGKSDPERWQSHTYALKSGNIGSYFILNQNGILFVKRTAYDSFVVKRTWTITIRVTDDGIMNRGGLWYQEDKQYTDKVIRITMYKDRPPEWIEVIKS